MPVTTCPTCPCYGTPTLSPDGTGRLGVMIVSDSMTDSDAVGGKALVGREGAMLARTLSRYGWKWTDFWCASAAFCNPRPNVAFQASQTCSKFDAYCKATGAKVYLTVGKLAFERLTGLRVPPMLARGYVWPALDGGWVVAALPPTYYRVDPGMLVTFLADAAKAVRIADSGFAYDTTIQSVAAPARAEWDAYVQDFLADPSRVLAADIETPYKRKSEMSEEELAGEDMTYTIEEVNFCYDGVKGVSVPFTADYIDGIKAMLTASQQHGTTIFWNAAYDVPRLEHNGIPAFDPRHTRDAMDTFRVWRNSVRRSLVVATSLLPSCWNVKPWKHLGTGDAFYRSMDVISLWRNDRDLFAALKAEGQWEAYQLFVQDLDPELVRMTEAGVKVDPQRVSEVDSEITSYLTDYQRRMTKLVPMALLATQVWQRKTTAELGRERLIKAGELMEDAKLQPVAATKRVKVCGNCGMLDIKKEHVTRKTKKEMPDANTETGQSGQSDTDDCGQDRGGRIIPLPQQPLYSDGPVGIAGGVGLVEERTGPNND